MTSVKPFSCLSAFVLLIIAYEFSTVHCSQIIGSSVVTSVSVIRGDEKKTAPTTIPPTIKSTTPIPVSTTHRPSPTPVTSRPDTKLGDEGVLSVIATLKSIVEKEQKKHTNGLRGENSQTTNPNSKDDESPSPPTGKSSLQDDDLNEDDEADDEEAEMPHAHTEAPIKRTIPPPTTTTTTENDTASSVEVHTAIHRISGALLKPGEKKAKPIENILTDVLTKINGARNGTGPAVIQTTIVPDTSSSSHHSKNKSSSKSGPTTKKPKKPNSNTTASSTPRPRTTTAATTASTMTSRSNKTKTTTTRGPTTTTTLGPIFPAIPGKTKVKNGSREPQLGNTVHLKIQGIQVDDNSPEVDTVEDMLDRGDLTTVKYTRPSSSKPKPPKPQYIYSNSGRINASVTHMRPADFYDDEIFGYDPYQTFHHGVYVPVAELDGGNVNTGEPEVLTTTCKTDLLEDSHHKPHHEHNQYPIRSSTARTTTKPSTLFNLHGNNQKPVPNLPDHLHRPRPSHLQYQHTAVETVDTETGQVAVKVPHPGEKHANPDENFAPDRLASQPRPQLPVNVVKNLTDHHHEAHHGSHGHGGAHGHDAHGHGHDTHDHHGHDHHHLHHEGPPEKRPTFDKAPNGNPGLEATITNLDPEMRTFVDVNNKVALRLFSSLTNPVSKSSTNYNNMVLSPFTIISSLGMLFLGARGTTAAQLDGLLKFDDALTFNPHMMYYNVTQSFLSQSNTAAAIIRLLIADKQKGDVLDFFKTRVQHFYDTRVEEADYKFAGHLAQSIINQMIRAQIQRHSYEMLNYSLPLKGPMSLITAAFFDGQFSGARDPSVTDMHFIHLAALGRRLIQVPAVSLRGPMRAAYDNELDATAVEIPYTTRDLSLILLMPGRPGEFAIGGVTSLKSRLTLESWTYLMRGFYPRDSFKIVFPRFRHHTALNLSYTMQRFGLTDMFQPHLAKFKGINGLNDLHLDQNVQHFSEFGTWEKLSDTLSEANMEGNKKFDLIRILRPQVREQYGTSAEPLSVSDWIFKSKSPLATATMSPRDANWQSYQPFFAYSRVRSTRSGRREPRGKKIYYYRQSEPVEPGTEDEKILRFERPFLYILRHNPTGMILMTGQYSEPVVTTEE